MDLFHTEPLYPEGFSYYPDFISEEEEEMLLALVGSIPLHTLIFQGFEAKRKVAGFGYDYHFDTRHITKGAPIPSEFTGLITRIEKKLSLRDGEIAKLLLTEYPVGSVINWHRDAPPFELIAGISLLSDCVFRLRPYDKTKQSRSSVISFPVQRRSLYVIQGAARQDWEHSISPVKQKRYSITLRTLRQAGDNPGK